MISTVKVVTFLWTTEIQATSDILYLLTNPKSKRMTSQDICFQRGVSSTPLASTPAVNPLSRFEQSGCSAAIESDSKQSSANLCLVDPSSKRGRPKLIYAQCQVPSPPLRITMKVITRVRNAKKAQGFKMVPKGQSARVALGNETWFVSILGPDAMRTGMRINEEPGPHEPHLMLAFRVPYRIDVLSHSTDSLNTDRLGIDFRPNKNARRFEPCDIPGYGPSQPLSGDIIVPPRKKQKRRRNSDSGTPPPPSPPPPPMTPADKPVDPLPGDNMNPGDTRVGHSLPALSLNPSSVRTSSSPYSSPCSPPITSSSSVTSQLPALSDLLHPSTLGQAVTSYATASELEEDDATCSSFLEGNHLHRGVSDCFFPEILRRDVSQTSLNFDDSMPDVFTSGSSHDEPLVTTFRVDNLFIPASSISDDGGLRDSMTTFL
eukprot:g37518.t1